MSSDEFTESQIYFFVISDFVPYLKCLLMAPLCGEWERKIRPFLEEFHMRKMRQLQEEVTSAVVWEKGLEERLRKIKENVTPPPLMKFCDQFESRTGGGDHV